MACRSSTAQGAKADVAHSIWRRQPTVHVLMSDGYVERAVVRLQVHSGSAVLAADGLQARSPAACFFTRRHARCAGLLHSPPPAPPAGQDETRRRQP